MNNFCANLGGRKFVFSVAVVILSFILVLFGFMGEENWVVVSLGVTGMFVGGNVAQKTFAEPNRSGNER
ncbi:MAG: hypothetical protein LWW76_02600 [Burkholderiales bacterium]|nr:hypothetical protein [Burkholderiales bacterium]